VIGVYHAGEALGAATLRFASLLAAAPLSDKRDVAPWATIG
jgi:hypothetical protein